MTKSEKLAKELDHLARFSGSPSFERDTAAHMRALQRAVEEAPHDEGCSGTIHWCNCFKAEFMREVD